MHCPCSFQVLGNLQFFWDVEECWIEWRFFLTCCHWKFDQPYFEAESVFGSLLGVLKMVVGWYAVNESSLLDVGIAVRGQEFGMDATRA